MPAETLDAWEEAARKEVERQAFIDASLGPWEFRKNWMNKRDQRCDCQGRWRRGGSEQKAERDPDAMDVDAIHLQGIEGENRKDKQKVEGRCFLCNKQGHLKRDCPTKGKEGPSSKRFMPSTTIRAAYSDEKMPNDNIADQESTKPQRVEDLMTRLRGMTVEEKDEVIDALVCEENF
jgi:hypothetical protein